MESTQPIGNLKDISVVLDEAIEETMRPKVSDNVRVTIVPGTVVLTVLGSLEVKGSNSYFQATASEKDIWDRVRYIARYSLDFEGEY